MFVYPFVTKKKLQQLRLAGDCGLDEGNCCETALDLSRLHLRVTLWQGRQNRPEDGVRTTVMEEGVEVPPHGLSINSGRIFVSHDMFFDVLLWPAGNILAHGLRLLLVFNPLSGVLHISPGGVNRRRPEANVSRSLQRLHAKLFDFREEIVVSIHSVLLLGVAVPRHPRTKSAVEEVVRFFLINEVDELVEESCLVDLL
jgi:hypothetical protein